MDCSIPSIPEPGVANRLRPGNEEDERGRGVGMVPKHLTSGGAAVTRKGRRRNGAGTKEGGIGVQESQQAFEGRFEKGPFFSWTQAGNGVGPHTLVDILKKHYAIVSGAYQLQGMQRESELLSDAAKEFGRKLQRLTDLAQQTPPKSKR